MNLNTKCSSKISFDPQHPSLDQVSTDTMRSFARIFPKLSAAKRSKHLAADVIKFESFRSEHRFNFDAIFSGR
jgi:hypothetical protein